MRDRSVATPSPDRSSSAAARPVIAISREIAGPVTKRLSEILGSKVKMRALLVEKYKTDF